MNLYLWNVDAQNKFLKYLKYFPGNFLFIFKSSLKISSQRRIQNSVKHLRRRKFVSYFCKNFRDSCLIRFWRRFWVLQLHMVSFSPHCFWDILFFLRNKLQFITFLIYQFKCLFKSLKKNSQNAIVFKTCTKNSFPFSPTTIILQ